MGLMAMLRALRKEPGSLGATEARAPAEEPIKAQRSGS